jgi:glycosyltransferase involved in cell wall biosynthesis
VSNNNRDHIAASFGIPSEELLTVPNGADFSRFLPQGEAEKRQIRRDVRNEFCLDADALLLLTVGRLDAQKGYPDLIEAIPTVLQHHPKAHFLWVGDGEQRAEIEHQLAAMNLSGIVTLAGRRTDIPRLMAAADLFVFPTRFEGQPFSLLEAMAAEMAIVSTEASGIPEILRHEKEGLLCPVGDSSQLAGAIHTMLSRPEDQKRFGSAARARAGEFTEERMCRETIAVLQRLVTSSGALHA